MAREVHRALEEAAAVLLDVVNCVKIDDGQHCALNRVDRLVRRRRRAGRRARRRVRGHLVRGRREPDDVHVRAERRVSRLRDGRLRAVRRNKRKAEGRVCIRRERRRGRAAVRGGDGGGEIPVGSEVDAGSVAAAIAENYSTTTTANSSFKVMMTGSLGRTGTRGCRAQVEVHTEAEGELDDS